MSARTPSPSPTPAAHSPAAPQLRLCPGDLHNDQQVDDADFLFFALNYNTLDCAAPTMPPGCPADLNAENAVDDSDFVMFVGAYNELVCP